jgi:hypothetical protein
MEMVSSPFACVRSDSHVPPAGRAHDKNYAALNVISADASSNCSTNTLLKDGCCTVVISAMTKRT